MVKFEQEVSIEALIDEVVVYANGRSPAEQPNISIFIKFIRLYYLHASFEELQKRTIADLYEAALSHWELMQQRTPNELKIRVLNPEYETKSWLSRRTVIEVITDDMPFLVDSMRIEMNRMGLTMHLMVYMGGMHVIRDSKGCLVDIISFGKENKDVLLESPIYMEIERQIDPTVLENIHKNLVRVLGDVRIAVTDWKAMRQKVEDTIKDLMANTDSHNAKGYNESIAFLEWLLEEHFTFLGIRDYTVTGSGEDKALRLVPGSSLGVLRDESESKTYRYFSDLPDAARKLVLAKDNALLLSKTNTRSTVHRDSYTDYIGVKLFDKEGQFITERRIIGLYTSNAYTGSPKTIPIIRKKVTSVLSKSNLPLRSHSGKDLLHILSTLPRDDLFHASVNELYHLSLGILYLQERREIRLFVREDSYGRFVSCLVYVPKENFNADLVRRMQDILKKDMGGLEVSLSTQFSSSTLVRIHYVVRVNARDRKAYDLKSVEKKLIQVGQSWQDGFRLSLLEHFDEEKGTELINRYNHAFPAGYRENFPPQNTVFDIETIESLTSEDMLGMSFYRPQGASKKEIYFKLYHLGVTVPLSDALPILENMGLRVESEQPYSILPKGGPPVWINDFGMTYAREPEFEVEQVKEIFQQAFNQIWIGVSENDCFNRLVLEAELNWREITILRGYSRYFRQTGFTFSHEYIGEALTNNPVIAKLLIEVFNYRFNPKKIKKRDDRILEAKSKIYKKLDEVSSLDEDRIMRHYLHAIEATLRTNYFQVDEEGRCKPYLSFKISTSDIPDMPLPLPKYEIFLYSPRFEGVHLRAGKVARGGLRWSDRREDFRTEILGLMKAQNVKNALIVPNGAKGGFVPKRLPVNGTREETLEEAIGCYREFISGLLDITDNLEDNEVVSPADVVIYDDADPYLVVAADKGTATFSDIANGIAIKRGYWLGDAFASGGSTGYDHKKIGITARGAWVSARRQFEELGINLDKSEITVLGIGDMSGDVFGNGMLLSQHLKLVAAFNHQHIFLDPAPDPKISFEERKRLFNLPRSNWSDYNRDLISEGGGVYSRALKSIPLSEPIKKLLDTHKEAMVPTDLIRALLKASVDMIWNGGIGTYMKSSTESHQDVGDRSNDIIRVNGEQVRARVVCEGGNLGCTQLGRIEYELNGGKINTDFVDNSAGVDCSDREVNIKILLNQVVADGKMTEDERNRLLADMTEEVAHLVLQNNYQQNRAISWLSAMSHRHLSLYISELSAQEQAGKINRELEFLPSNKELQQRKMDKQGLTKPEMAVLFAYSKNTLRGDILRSNLPEGPYLGTFIKELFPIPLRKNYNDYMLEHRLRREIIATQLSNRLVEDMGVTFVFQMQDETGASIPMIVRAYAAARSIFHMAEFYTDIESLDYKIDAKVQYQINEEAVTLVRRATRWFLFHRGEKIDVREVMHGFADHIVYLFRRLPKYLLGEDKTSLESRRDALIAANVTPDIALRVACVEPMYHALNIIEVATQEGIEIKRVAQVYFVLLNRLKLIWFRQQINAYIGGDIHWVFLAKSSYKADLDVIQSRLTKEVLHHIEPKTTHIAEQVDAWLEMHGHLVDRWHSILTELRTSGVKEFAVISVAIRELSNLAQAKPNNNGVS